MSTNCIISIANFGRARVRATRVVHGMSVVAYAGEAESRAGKAFYPSKRTSGSFELTLVFAKDRNYRRICNWLERYSRWAANPRTKASVCRVMIPSRKFDKLAVLRSGVTYGDDVRNVSHTITLSFVGSSDPLDMKDPAISRFKLSKRARKDEALPYFYPGGKQLKGDASPYDYDWDRTPAQQKLVDITTEAKLENLR